MKLDKNNKIAVLLRDLSQLGGGERDVVILIEGLNEIGIIPDLFCEKFTSQESIYKVFHKRIDYIGQNIKKPIYIKFINEIFWNPLSFRLRKYDFIFDFTNKPPLMNSSNYFKYIYTLSDTRAFSNSGYKYLKNFYKTLGKYGIKKFNMIQTKNITVTQSLFIQKEIYKTNNIKLPIIFPPVDIALFHSINTKRKKSVVSIGRFSYEKNQMDQLKVAEKLREYNFYITGSYHSGSKNYYESLLQYKKDNDLTNVTFLKNISMRDLKKLLSNSLFFLHTTFEEHFGISTVEAIAAGSLPIVHNSGGQKEIVPFKALRFDNIDDAVRQIKHISNLSQTRIKEIRTDLQKHITQYDEYNFKKNIFNSVTLK